MSYLEIPVNNLPLCRFSQNDWWKVIILFAKLDILNLIRYYGFNRKDQKKHVVGDCAFGTGAGRIYHNGHDQCK